MNRRLITRMHRDHTEETRPGCDACASEAATIRQEEAALRAAVEATEGRTHRAFGIAAAAPIIEEQPAHLRRYDWHSDPGHAWLAVPVADLRALRLRLGDWQEGHLSAFSYLDGNGSTAYLEEDCDAGTFIRAAEAAGWRIATETAAKQYRGDAPIRRMRSLHDSTQALPRA